MGRFINADALVSTGQGILGNNSFVYCGNNPILYVDPTGTEYRLVGVGFQFEIDSGNGVVGVEVIIYWDVDECSDGGAQVAVYIYGGISLDVNDVFLASILATITENSDVLIEGTEAVWIAMASKLSDSYSIGISAVAIWGDEEFTNTEAYEGSFSSIGFAGGKFRTAYAQAEHCSAVSLGGSVVGIQLFPTISVAKTIYWELCEFHLPK